MNASFNKPELEANQILMDKQALADRYQVGVHTIERWQAAGIIDGERRGSRNYYHLEDSERRLWNHGETKAVMKKSQQIPIDAKYVGKRALAARYSVSLHTIDKWMTATTYTDASLLSLQVAVQKLGFPASQEASQILGAAGHLLTQSVTNSAKANGNKTIEKKGGSRCLTRRGTSCLKSRNGARCRFRTCDPYRVKVMLYH